jgi:hypothetical protein
MAQWSKNANAQGKKLACNKKILPLSPFNASVD